MSSSSHNPAYVPGPTFGFVKLLASSAHIALSEPMSSRDKQGSSLGSFPTFPSPFIPTLIGLRAFDLVSSRVWWEAATNKQNKHYLDDDEENIQKKPTNWSQTHNQNQNRSNYQERHSQHISLDIFSKSSINNSCPQFLTFKNNTVKQKLQVQ